MAWKTNNRFLEICKVLLALITLLCLGTVARAQSASAQDDRRVQDNDSIRGNPARFDQFLDSHREIAEQLRKDPSLVNRREFVENHPALQAYLQSNPGVREQLRQDPNGFMRQENNFDRRDDVRERDVTRRDLAEFDRFLDSHGEIAEQVRKNPSLVDNREFVQNRPALQEFLQKNPGVRDQLRQDPNAFMRDENRF